MDNLDLKDVEILELKAKIKEMKIQHNLELAEVRKMAENILSYVKVEAM